MADMINNSNLNNVFVWVPSAKVDSYKSGVGVSSASYKKKIAFLEGTGEIMTQGVVFALNKTSDIEALQTLIGGDNTNFAAGVQSTTIIAFLNELKGYIDTNTTAIGSTGVNGSGLAKKVEDLESTVGNSSDGLVKDVADNADAIALLNRTDGTVGSVKKTVDDAIAAVVANAPTAFDTLKEIADWIGSGGVESTTAATMLSDITTLKTKVGDAGTPQVGEPGDPDYAAAVASTGIYASIDDLQGQIDSMTGGAGSIQTQITNALNGLDSSVTLQGTTLSQPQSATKDTIIDVLGSITVAEVDGELDQTTSSYIVLQADAAGAAAAAYTALLGTAADASDGTAYTIHGVQNYAKAIVDAKNVTASGDNSLISASASNNAVSVGATQDLIDAVSHANTAIQSVTISSNNVTYLTVSADSGSGASTTASASITPVFGTLSSGANANPATTLSYTDGLASTKIVADAINSVTLWETYVEQNP